MATQEIPSSGGDYIDNVVNASWRTHKGFLGRILA